MKNILLKNNGEVNEEGIQEYIATKGVDMPFQNQTLLTTTVSSPELPEKVKLLLANYLFLNGALPSRYDNFKNGGLIAIALSQENFELATLLLANNANLKDTYQNLGLIDFAVHSKNPNIMSWVLRNAQMLFFKLDQEDFNSKYKKIASTFPTDNNLLKELYQLREQYITYIKNEISKKFVKLGLIYFEELVLILAAKMSKKNRENTIFIITDDDIPELIKQIKLILTQETTDIIKFQIIHYRDSHTVFGEFEINKSSQIPLVKYTHCDPAPPLTSFKEIITKKFKATISPLAKIEIYDSDVSIQKGLGCTYFSVDGAMMLATPPDRDYTVNLTRFIKEHGKEEKIKYLEKDKNIIYILSSILPARFIRGMHFYDDELVGQTLFRGLSSFIFNTNEKNTVVNKNGETAEKSIQKDIEIIIKENKPDKKLNQRVIRKMKQFGEEVKKYLENKDIFDENFSRELDTFKIKGLVEFINKKIVIKNENNPSEQFKL